MKLILIRHAEAVPLGTDGPATDFDRDLTDLGRRQAAALARALARAGVVPDAVYSSPLVRAKQTADLIAADRLVQFSERLGFGTLKPKRLSELACAEPAEVVYFVGHMPPLADYAAWLLGVQPKQVKFAKAGATCLDVGPRPRKGRAKLVWAAVPELLA